MAEENPIMELKKRKLGKRKNPKMRKKKKPHLPEGVRDLKPKKIGQKMKKLFRKRARDYNSDDEDEELDSKKEENEDSFEEEEEEEGEEEDGDQKVNYDNEFSDEEEEGEIQPGITKFTEGCRAFRVAFKSIIKKAIHDDPLGPVLSAHKKLVAEKLAEEEAERKNKKLAKREKHVVGEKGHVIPEKYLDSHEKFLIGVATKGVVKLFNAVNKAQHAQKGLNPSSFKDEKAIKKRRKEAFFSELGKTPSATANTTAKARASSGQADDEGPVWAPLRDNYMLTSSKLKDWDKMPETTVTDEIGNVSEDSSSDED